jgi:hypothetical protein
MSLDQAVSIITRLTREEVRQRESLLANEIQQVKERANARGALLSGFTVESISVLVRDEFRIRVALFWEIVQRVLSSTGLDISTDYSQRLQALLAEFLDGQSEQLTSVLRMNVASINHGWNENMIPNERRELESATGAKIELFSLEVEARAASSLSGDSAARSETVYNFHNSNIGALQSGQNASANVTQSVTSFDPAGILKALEVVEKAVDGVQQVALTSKAEVVEVIRELKAEVQKPKPNRLKVTQLLSGLAAVVQTTASLQPAYGMLRPILLSFGIQPPI